MKEQKVIVLSGSDYASEMQVRINEMINEGWFVVSVTAQHVATGSSQSSPARGGYLIVLEK